MALLESCSLSSFSAFPQKNQHRPALPLSVGRASPKRNAPGLPRRFGAHPEISGITCAGGLGGRHEDAPANRVAALTVSSGSIRHFREIARRRCPAKRLRAAKVLPYNDLEHEWCSGGLRWPAWPMGKDALRFRQACQVFPRSRNRPMKNQPCRTRNGGGRHGRSPADARRVEADDRARARCICGSVELAACDSVARARWLHCRLRPNPNGINRRRRRGHKAIDQRPKGTGRRRGTLLRRRGDHRGSGR